MYFIKFALARFFLFLGILLTTLARRLVKDVTANIGCNPFSLSLVSDPFSTAYASITEEHRRRGDELQRWVEEIRKEYKRRRDYAKEDNLEEEYCFLDYLDFLKEQGFGYNARIDFVRTVYNSLIARWLEDDNAKG